jgi:hypothetical protein
MRTDAYIGEKITRARPQHALKHVGSRYRSIRTKDASRLAARRNCFELIDDAGEA